MEPEINWRDIQGNILRGYNKQFVRHLVLTVDKPAGARRWLADATSGDPARAPQITTAEPWGKTRPSSCVNLGITYAGLARLGLSAESLASFPHEFVAGMPARSKMLGDTGPSDPSSWKREWQDQSSVHVMISVYADDAEERAAVADRILATDGAFELLAALDGEGFPEGKVHFGYRDSISQPQFYGVQGPGSLPDDQPLVEIGAMLLGHATPIEDLRWRVPSPDVLGFNGSFNAFRLLEQQVEAFEDFLTECADRLMKDPLGTALLPPGEENKWVPPRSRHAALREMVAAKMLGRWFNGVPLELSPYSPTPSPPITDEEINKYGYSHDPEGQRCPIGSHMRRSNPRDAKTVQRNTNHARRLIRRGIPYGPHYDPAKPVKAERGLLGSFMCASLTAQFEALQYDWINLGLQDPRITGTNDVVIGNNDPLFSRFSFPVGEGEVTFRGFPSFVHTRGGAYLFQPSIPAIGYLAALSDGGSTRKP
jgi:deferrochelatase/peroxidase EfeB